MALTIVDNKFMKILECLDIKTTSDIPITSFNLIDDKIGAWYEYIDRQNIWNDRKFWTYKMCIVLIGLKLLLHLVVEKIISARNSIKNWI